MEVRLILGILIAALILPLQAAATPETDYFERHVRPLLVQHCFACHSQQAPVLQADLRVDSRAALLAGGRSGPAIVPGHPEASLLVSALQQTGGLRMPPTGTLSEDQVAHVANWIKMGAPYPEPPDSDLGLSEAGSGHWSLSLPRSEEPPPSSSGWATTGIDRFIEARLAEAGLGASPEAAPETLVRRLHYDLTGLPPPQGAADAFLRSPTDERYRELVDKLLESQHFGERWARHWLDVVRYADDGYFGKPFPAAWTYRDWVIEAFNEDMPYDRFVQYQLAADLLGTETRHLAALGLLTLGINHPRPVDRPLNLDDRIDVVTRGLLGLSVACARCHDHKYDSIPQADYYSLYGVFLNSPDVIEPVALDPVSADATAEFFQKKLAARREWIDRFRSERLQDHLREFRRPEVLAQYLEQGWASRHMTDAQAQDLARERNLNLYMLNRWRAYLSGLVGPSVEAFSGLGSPGGAMQIALEISEADSTHRWPDPRREALRLALRGNGSPTDVPFEDFWWVQDEGDSNVVKALKWQYEAVVREWGHRGGPRHASVVRDARVLQPAVVFVRGNQHARGDTVPRRFLSALPGPEEFTEGSGRLELARLIASPENPLTARVLVNRVWAHLLGSGIVATTSDFGIRGERPSHPRLLDYLATGFVKDGWSLKGLVRRIVTSRTYRQSSALTPALAEQDPSNRWLARQNRTRLDFEALRDSMLAVSGRLDTSMGGIPFDLRARPSSPRRSIYAHVSRESPSQLMRAFDFPNAEEHTPRRQLTTVPQQALFLMNSPFLSEQSRAVAASCTEGGECLEGIHRTILGRAPGPEERLAAMEFMQSVAGDLGVPRDEPASGNGSWLHGTASIDPVTGEVSDFRSMEYTVDDQLQPSPMMPDPVAGRASLTADGGQPGDGTESAVVRRWKAPDAMRVELSGTLSHRMGSQSRRFNYSNGVRGWVVSDRQGMLASWRVRGSEAETVLRDIDVQQGEHLDFVVDSLEDYESDSFRWTPGVREVPTGESASAEPRQWIAGDAFATRREPPLTAMEQYAQTLLMTNEFAYKH